MIDLHFLRYRAKQEIGNFRSFLALQPLKNPKNQNFERWKNLLEISSFNTCAPKINHMMYGSWDTEWDTKFFVILGNFLPFYLTPSPPTCPPPPNDLKYQDFEKKKKWKKCLEILLFYTYMCTINEDHMIYDSWNIRCDRQTFLTFLSIFCFFSPLTTWKIKILTSKKTPGDIVILHICTINDNHMIYSSWDIEHDRQFFVILNCFLPFTLPPPHRPKKSKFLKQWKKHLKIL